MSSKQITITLPSLKLPRVDVSQLKGPGVRLSRLSLESLTTALVFALGFAITILPYLVFEPAFPYGSDMQHPQSLLSLLTQGQPTPLYPEYLNRQYPDTYGFLSGVFARLMALSSLPALALLTSICMLLSMLALYFLSRELYGKRAALFALVAFGLLSIQPRQTYLDGTRIELVSGLLLVPLALLTLHHALTREGRGWSVAAGLIVGALIRYHFIGTVQAGVTAAVFIALLAIFRRDLATREAFKRLALIVVVACALSFPFSWYYVQIVIRIGLGRLGLLPIASEQEASFPAIQNSDEVLFRLGGGFVILGLLAIGALFAKRWSQRPLAAGDLLMMAWVGMLVFGSFTPTLLVPERFLRNLAMPLSVLIGAFLALMSGRRFLLTALLTVMIILSVPLLALRVVEISITTNYAQREDLPALQALKAAVAREPERVTLADDSGVWVPFFVGANSRYIAGGPEGFKWFGEPLRSEMLELWNAHQNPCELQSLSVFEKYKIGYIYAGRTPTNWTLPGYAHVDGSKYVACPRYETVFNQSTDSGDTFVFRLRPVAEAQPPAWVPAEGLTNENALSVTPPAPTDDRAQDAYYRQWYAGVMRSAGELLGKSRKDLESLATPSPKVSAEQIWKEGTAMQRAIALGVKGDRQLPSYHFKLWLELGQPAAWPPNDLPYDLALNRAISFPFEGTRTPALQWWYAANRAKYNTVYYGFEDPDPSIHKEWAAAHSDVDLYNEVTAMWSAHADGVVGSANTPREAFNAWLSRKLSSLR